jgi:hypothetical protein
MRDVKAVLYKSELEDENQILLQKFLKAYVPVSNLDPALLNAVPVTVNAVEVEDPVGTVIGIQFEVQLYLYPTCSVL